MHYIQSMGRCRANDDLTLLMLLSTAEARRQKGQKRQTGRR